MFSKDSIIMAMLQCTAQSEIQFGISEPDFAPFDLEQLGRQRPNAPGPDKAQPNINPSARAA
jgi:hypothetical protein